MNNYAVTLMVLFYLQNNGFLPTLDELRSLIPEKEQVFINGWNCSFPVNPTHVQNISLRSYSLSELLAGFFSFYGKIDFAKTVVDLRTAKLSPISELMQNSAPSKLGVPCTNKNIVEVPESSPRSQNFKVGFLNIRDPFELFHNVTGNVNEKHLKIFTKRIRNASLACKMIRYQTKGKTKEKWGLLNLFVDHHHKETNTLGKQKPESLNGCKIVIRSAYPKHEAWNPQHVAGLVVTVLRDVFHVTFSNILPDHAASFPFSQSSSIFDNYENGVAKCRSCPDNPPSGEAVSRKRKASSPESCGLCKRAKLMMSSPTTSRISSVLDTFSIQLPFASTCVATHKLWEGRRKARRRLVQKGKSDVLDLEMQVSRLLLSDLSNNDGTENGAKASESFNTSCSSTDSTSKALFHFFLSLSSDESDSLSVIFDSDSHSSDFSTFFHHLEIFLPNFVLKCLNH